MPTSNLWSLWEMLRVQASALIDVGHVSESLRIMLYQSEAMRDIDQDQARLTPGETKDLKKHLTRLSSISDKLDLPVAFSLINDRIDNPPKTANELSLLLDAVRSELKSKLFFYVEASRAKYWNKDDLLSEFTQAAFPTAYSELKESSNCYALERYTATVFHSMRAAEMGVRLLAADLNIDPNVVDTQTWGTVQKQIRGAINRISNQPKSPSRDADIEFYSQAAAQLQYFNDGWRVRVAHTKANYNQQQALDAIQHVCALFESISSRLKEAP